MLKPKIYIAGKITGLPVAVYATKFNAMALELRSAGFEVVNPVELVSDPNTEWTTAMKACVIELVQCNAVYLLPCVENSKGAKIEKQLAENLHIPTFTSLWCLKNHFKAQN